MMLEVQPTMTEASVEERCMKGAAPRWGMKLLRHRTTNCVTPVDAVVWYTLERFCGYSSPHERPQGFASHVTPW